MIDKKSERVARERWIHDDEDKRALDYEPASPSHGFYIHYREVLPSDIDLKARVEELEKEGEKIISTHRRLVENNNALLEAWNNEANKNVSLEARLKQAEEVIAFYGNKNNWMNNHFLRLDGEISVDESRNDYGYKARAYQREHGKKES